jgi:hypothetical protein
MQQRCSRDAADLSRDAAEIQQISREMQHAADLSDAHPETICSYSKEATSLLMLLDFVLPAGLYLTGSLEFLESLESMHKLHT